MKTILIVLVLIVEVYIMTGAWCINHDNNCDSDSDTKLTLAERVRLNRATAERQEADKQACLHKLIDSWFDDICNEIIYTKLWKPELDVLQKKIDKGEYMFVYDFAIWNLYRGDTPVSRLHPLPNIDGYDMYLTIDQADFRRKINKPNNILHGCTITLESCRYSIIELRLFFDL
jgi:hypothetical protein